jgi:flagellar basal-body rod protein FlgB
VLISDLTTETLRAGLSGLNERRRAAEDAVANMETPGYIARQVDFEDQLAAAVDSGNPASFRPSITPTSDAPLPNGNNVKVDAELVSLSETGLRQQLLVEAVNAKFRLMRTVIGGS